MSLYYEASAVLANSDKAGGSLKSRTYRQKDLKSPPAQIVALVTEASKWSVVLKDVIEKSGLLAEERKLTPTLAVLLTHDLLISKRGVVAPASHVLKLAINRHKARLSAEFTKARIRGGHATLEAFRDAIRDGPLISGPDRPPAHPRWVRINTLKTTLEQEISSTFAGFEKADSFQQIMSARPSAKQYFLDENIPNLLALPPKVDLSKTKAYADGHIIFQDKASCFPAYLLDPRAGDGDLIDGTAAPGNKTTHLAALYSEKLSKTQNQNGRDEAAPRVMAFERDKFRTKTLEKMVKLASADDIVTIKGSQDFLDTRPNGKEFQNVGAILLDPSCSGSGIVGRDDAITMHLPDPNAKDPNAKPSKTSKKRKRNDKESKTAQPEASETVQMDLDDSVAEEEEEASDEDKLSERLNALSVFQLRILTHAMKFPKARRITYSTCSIHFEENEGVVFQALNSKEARKYGWKILKREDQVAGLKKWERRGVWEDEKLEEEVETKIQEKDEVLDACIRCEKATDDGTMGFFVAGFVRDESAAQGDSVELDVEESVPEVDEVEAEDEEWGGFSDEEVEVAQEKPVVEAKPKKSKPIAKKRKTKYGYT